MLRCARPARVGALAACATGPVAAPRAPSATPLPCLSVHRPSLKPLAMQRRALGALMHVRCVARTYATEAQAPAPPVAPRYRISVSHSVSTPSTALWLLYTLTRCYLHEANCHLRPSSFTDLDPITSAHRSLPSKCTGCGVKLQTDKEKGRGFVPLAKFEATVGDIVCYRCWGMRHHNKLLKAEVHDLSVIERVRLHTKSVCVCTQTATSA